MLQTDSEYEVEKIVMMRVKKDKTIEYLVRWVGYAAKDDTWELEAAVMNAPEKVQLFKRAISEVARAGHLGRNTRGRRTRARTSLAQ